MSNFSIACYVVDYTIEKMGYPASDDEEQEETVTPPANDTDTVLTNGSNSSTLPTENNRPRSASTRDENVHIFNSQERRSSLPPGVLERGHITSICGQILRYIGDEQYSLACGRHLRSMGDQLCYNYFIRNMVRRSGEFQHHSSSDQHLNGSHSTPNLNQNNDRNV